MTPFTTRIKLRILFCLSLAALAVVHVTAQNGYRYQFNNISIREGLGGLNVSCITGDAQGTIWVGTANGLDRLIGRGGIEHYGHIPGDGTSLPDDDVRDVFCDSHGQIWVVTATGVSRFDAARNAFVQVMDGRAPLKVLSWTEWKGDILFGGQDTVRLWSRATGEVSLRYQLPKGFAASYMHPTESNTLLIVHFEGGKILAADLDGGPAAYVPLENVPDRMMNAYVDAQGTVWLSRYKGGLLRYAFANGGLELIASYTAENSPLKAEVVNSLTESGGGLWLATDGYGLFRLDMTTGTLAPVTGGYGQRPSHVTYRAVYADAQGNIWAGSSRNGVARIRRSYIYNYTRANDRIQNGMSNNTVLCLWEDANHDLWIGTDGGGINRLDARTGIIDHYPATAPLKITAITRFSDHELLIYAYTAGTFLFDKRNGRLRRQTVPNPDTDQWMIAQRGQVRFHYARDTIWIFGSTQQVYDLKQKKFFPIVDDEGRQVQLYGRETAGVNGDTLFVYGGRAVSAIVGQRVILQHYRHSQKISAAAVDGRGSVWVGDKQGLWRAPLDGGPAQRIELPIGGEVSTVLCDPRGDVWVGMNNAVMRYRPDTGQTAVLDGPDDVGPNEYYNKASLAAANGDVFMGGALGLLRINRNFTPDDTAPHMALLSYTVGGVRHAPEGDRPYEIGLKHNYGDLSVRFIVTNNDLFAREFFRYHITGEASSVVEGSSDASLTLSALRSGKYRVAVSTLSRSEGWTAPVHILDITVGRPWYASWAMMAVYGLAALAVSLLAVRHFTRRRRRRVTEMIAAHNRQLADEKVRFMINISHELRTPLTLIHNPLKRLLKSASVSDDDHRSLEKISVQTRQMVQLVNMVLDLRRMEVGGMVLNVATHEVYAWVREIVDKFRDEFAAAGIGLRFEVTEGLSSLNFDAAQCDIILSNLLMNALKYSDAGSGVVVYCFQTEGYVRFSVIDRGIGIKPGETEKIFEHFYQSDHRRTGYGIGLSYAKMLTELHNGRIGGYGNADGIGSTFYFDIPTGLEAGSVHSEARPYINQLFDSVTATAPETEPFPTTGCSVLVVDDNSEVLAMLHESLREHFGVVYLATDGEEALRIARTSAPDVICSDVMMPRMNGFELCRAVKTDLNISHIPVVLLTAYGDPDNTLTGYKMGADHYLPKPFDSDFLVGILKVLLASAARRRQQFAAGPEALPSRYATISPADEQFVTRLDAYIGDNLHETEITPQAIASHLNVSRSLLYKKMKTLTGIGIMAYINRIRLARARELLAATDMRIGEIVTAVGFADISYFSTLFKQYAGMPPTEFRKKIHENTPEQPTEDER